MQAHTFTKKERLKRKKSIAMLFRKGHTLQLPLIRFYYLPFHPQKHGTHQILFAVHKKNIKKATLRNTIKRRLKEAYRLCKHKIKNIRPYFLLAYLYTAKKIKKPTYKVLLADVTRSLAHLQKVSNTYASTHCF